MQKPNLEINKIATKRYQKPTLTKYLKPKKVLEAVTPAPSTDS